MKYTILLIAAATIGVIAQTNQPAIQPPPKSLSMAAIESAYASGQVSGMNVGKKVYGGLITSVEAQQLLNNDRSNHLHHVRASVDK